jgi:hypothetical protein
VRCNSGTAYALVRPISPAIRGISGTPLSPQQGQQPSAGLLGGLSLADRALIRREYRESSPRNKRDGETWARMFLYSRGGVTVIGTPRVGVEMT